MAPLAEFERMVFDTVTQRDRETLSWSPGEFLFRLANAEHGNNHKNSGNKFIR